MKSLLEKVLQTRDDGQKEYAHDIDNVFANFDRVANTLNIPREKVLMTYLLKHIDGIVSYIEGHKSQREDVSGRIVDAIVYLGLLHGMIKDK
tara:strand:- start:479 stop:754 length:276 start_codon:yes stop_codon:yes gene_type:complete